MTNRRQILASTAIASSGILLGMLRPALAQTVQKLTRIIIGTPPGGYPDTVARLLIAHMKSYASTIVLENKAGAGQRIALEVLKNSASDGSTMMLSPAGPNVLYPHIYKTLSYKPFEDFIPVTTVFDTPSALVVGPMVPTQVKTVTDFIEWCRANPTKSAYGTPGAGTPMHFLGAMLATAGDIKYLHVPYQGSGPATQDVLGGQIASAIVPVPAVVQLREPERLRVLATTGPQRSSSLPDVPTMTEAGFPALEFSEWFGILLPAKTPTDIALALNGAVRNAMNADEFKSGLLNLSLEPAGSSMNDFAQRMRTDTDRWAPIIKASGFTIEWGRPRGPRNNGRGLSLHADREKHGKEVIERVRPDDPPAYLSVMASVVRNASDAEAEDPFASMTIEELKAEVLSWGLPVCSRSFELFRQSTVGDIRWLGAKSVMLLCQACQHRQIANVELLPDDVTLALIASKFVCPNCHQNGAHALPNWDAAPNQPPADSEDQESRRPSGDEGD